MININKIIRRKIIDNLHGHTLIKNINQQIIHQAHSLPPQAMPGREEQGKDNAELPQTNS
jgi:hypothetical protein